MPTIKTINTTRPTFFQSIILSYHEITPQLIIIIILLSNAVCILSDLLSWDPFPFSHSQTFSDTYLKLQSKYKAIYTPKVAKTRSGQVQLTFLYSCHKTLSNEYINFCRPQPISSKSICSRHFLPYRIVC